MEKEETDRETSEDEVVETVPPCRSIVWAILMVMGGFSLLGWFSDWTGGPKSRGKTVSQWLNITNKGNIWNGISANLDPMVEEFGPEAVPLFIAEFNHAVSGNRPDETWIQKTIPSLGEPRVKAKEIRYRCFRALSVLGRNHPGLVDRFFARQLATTNRHDAIRWMGNSGLQHFGFLTNLVAGQNEKDSGAAINALHKMGTNAQAAVPLVFTSLEKHGSTRGRRWWWHVLLIPKIGRHHPVTVPTLLSMLEHTNQDARVYSSSALLRLTNFYDQIRPEFVRVARQPITDTNDPGKYVANDLYRMGVPPDLGVPILMKRLEHWVALDGHNPDPNSQTRRWLDQIALYGAEAAPAIPLIESRVLKHLPESPKRLSPEHSLLRLIENSLRRIDPDWTRPTNSLSRP